MSLFAIICHDKPDSMALRMATRPAHLAHIQPLVDEGRLLCAGPTPVPNSDTVNGSIIIAEFADLAAAQVWADNDPYALAGLFNSVRVTPYKKVLP